MCGIFLFIEKKKLSIEQEKRIYNKFIELKRRGPDKSIYEELKKPVNIKIGFHRLAITGKSIKGDQPFKYDSINGKNMIYVVCNGEIYDYKNVITKYGLKPTTDSDCEVIGLLYKEYGIDKTCAILSGEYAFIICDIEKETGAYNIYVCNDRFGIRPIFMKENEYGIFFSSEIKGFLVEHIGSIERVKPRNYYTISKIDNVVIKKGYTEYYNLENIKTEYYEIEKVKEIIKNKFIEVVKGMMYSDREIGCLLSGGLDSSLVASVASGMHKKMYGSKLKTFSMGLPNSTDEYNAKLVATFIDSDHTHITFQETQFLNALPDVVRVIENYDITTVRASTGQFLISKWISENTDVKVLLTGDGSDELTGGYMYFHKAPSKKEFHEENIRLLNNIHFFDGNRADRCIAGNGIEARFPFLDYRFVEEYLKVDIDLRVPKNGLEKELLRSCFSEDNILPKEVLMRKKEGMSDACSSLERSWYKIIEEFVEKKYTNEEYKEKIGDYEHLKPYSKESLYYRELFDGVYGVFLEDNIAEGIVPYFWLPKWCGDIKNPSARVLDVYKNHNYL